MKKSGFLCSSRALKRALVSLHAKIPQKLPKPCDVLRDLGLDNTGGRLRRLKTFKGRVARALKRAGKLRLIPRGLRSTLIQTNILASGLWGVQGQGIAPTTMKGLRGRVGVSSGIQHRLGCVTVVWRLVEEPLKDPIHQTLRQSVTGFFDTVWRLSPSLRTQLARGWRLASAQ